MRRYRVRAHGTSTQEALAKLKDGGEIAGVRYVDDFDAIHGRAF